MLQLPLAAVADDLNSRLLALESAGHPVQECAAAMAMGVERACTPAALHAFAQPARHAPGASKRPRPTSDTGSDCSPAASVVALHTAACSHEQALPPLPQLVNHLSADVLQAAAHAHPSMSGAPAACAAPEPAAGDFARCHQLCVSALQLAEPLRRHAAQLLNPCFCISLGSVHAEQLARLAVQTHASAVFVCVRDTSSSLPKITAAAAQERSAAVGRLLAGVSTLQRLAVHVPAAFAPDVCVAALHANSAIAEQTALQHVDIDTTSLYPREATEQPRVQMAPHWLQHLAARTQLRSLRVAMHAIGDWSDKFSVYLSELTAVCSAAMQLVDLELSFLAPRRDPKFDSELRRAREIRDQRIHAAIAARTALTRLSLAGAPLCLLGSSEAISDMLPHLTCLQHLSLDADAPACGYLRVEDPALVQLTHLHLRGCRAALPLPTTLRSLHLVSESYTSSAYAQSVLEQLAMLTLLHDLHLSQAVLQWQAAGAKTLTALVALTCVHISTANYRRAAVEQWDTACAWLGPWVASLPALKRLQLIAPWRLGNGCSAGWLALAPHLAQATTLAELDLHVHCHVIPDDVVQMLRSLLAELSCVLELH